MLGSRWGRELRGGLPLVTHACNYWLQVGALNTTSTVSFGRLPDPSRNSSLPDTLTFGPPISAFISRPALSPPKSPSSTSLSSKSGNFHLCRLFLCTTFFLMSFAVPAYSRGSLSNDEGGVSSAVHRLVGERDWMLSAGLVQSDNCGGIRAVRWTLTQALQQSKLPQLSGRKTVCFCCQQKMVSWFVECRITLLILHSWIEKCSE